MDGNHLDRLQQALSALNILSPTTFSFAGQIFDDRVHHDMADQIHNRSQSPTINRLSQVFYSFVYAQRFNGAVQFPPDEHEQVAEDLVEVLSQANMSHERWDANWQIDQVLPSGQVVAAKNGITRLLWPGEFITYNGPGTPARIGSIATVFSMRESRTAQPGFYIAFGETQREHFDQYETIRFYWNVRASGAPDLVRAITRCLNRLFIPFHFKICSRRNLFSRLDSAVLYVSKRHYHITSLMLVDIYYRLRPFLETDTPMFTRFLAPGLALAEDPATGESFGMFCCRLVAEGTWNAYVQDKQDLETRIESIRSRFQLAGVGFEQPYLRPGSRDIYEVPVY